MRVLPFVLVAALAAPVLADDNVAGTYDAKFEEAGSTCNPPPVALGRGKVTIEVKRTGVTVNTDLIPLMVGSIQKNGKITAKTLKVVGTTVQGLSGKYSTSGRVDNGMLALVLVAEYIRQDNNKPYCTQSWNVSGLRQDAKAGSKDQP
ncbi:MAG TPA: hypothetical protein VLX92_01565 [Kofleriaceae bacterium]|nr:hypothetical protein [Kofleriaceae bacterium]